MALTPAEIVSAESDYLDGDGAAFQFTRSAILAFVRDRLGVQTSAYNGNVYVVCRGLYS